MLIKGSNNTEFASCPEGSHIARCIKVIDLGTQKGEYEGKVTMNRKIMITWELPLELIQEGELKGKPFGISQFYTAKLGDKARLRADLKNWRGRDFTPEELNGFEIKQILGKPCMVSVVKNGEYTNVASVMALPKGMSCPDLVNPIVYFSMDEYDEDAFNGLSEKLQAKIRLSPEFAELGKTETSKEIADSEIPF
jgi:hypothetical protein